MRSRDSAVELLREICRMSTLVRDERAELVPYVARHDSARGRGVGVLCVDPAPWLARHHRAVAGTVLMSATLEPQDYYTAILGLDALPIATQRLPSPFPRRNRCIRIVPSVATTFRRRAASTRRVARIIGQVLAAQPGRYAAFFPSFAYLEGVRRRLPLSSRRLIVQRRTMTAADREDSLRELRRRRGTVLLLAVAGGAFAEGIDLPGKGLMGAIIVGPALPPVGFETAMMRDYYEGRYRRGFAFAMLYPGMQRVIQAAGRVIRSPHDRGVIVLVGRRFAEADYAACLPAEWYHDDPRELLTDGLGAALHDFWQRQAPATPAAMHVPAFKPSSPRPARR